MKNITNLGAPETEFSESFVDYMMKAMALSFHKYGALVEAYPERVDAVGSLMERLRKYTDTGNTEYLVDVANFAMIEFMHSRHPKAHFKAESSKNSPGRRMIESGRLTHEDNSGRDLKPTYSEKSKIANMRDHLDRHGY